MRSNTSNELVAFSLLALLALGNLVYLLLPSFLAGKQETYAEADPITVGSIPPQGAASPISRGNADITAEDKAFMSAHSGADTKGSFLLQSDFAIVFEPRASLEELQNQWEALREKYQDSLENMMPLARIEERGSDGSRQITLHLAVGPFENVQDAAYLCVSLQRFGEMCRVSPFSGQPLDILGQAALYRYSREARPE